MATFGLPDRALLSDEVQSFLPFDYDGVSKEPMLVSIFEKLAEKHVISDKLKNLHSLSQNLPVLFAGLAETFPESEAVDNDFWSIEAESVKDALFWFSMFQSYGNILDNGTFLTIREALKAFRSGQEADKEAYLDEDVLRRSFEFYKFLRDEGSYTSVSDCYFFLSQVDDEEALKLMASGISTEEYRNYCAIECYTYSEIFEGATAQLPTEWLEFLFENLVEDVKEDN